MNIYINIWIYIMNISEEKYEEITRDGIRYRVGVWNSLPRLFFIILLYI